jgi:rubrerythrin
MNPQLIAWTKYAIDIEGQGVSFYSACLQKAENSYAKQLFNFLVQEESRHEKTLNQVLLALTDGDEQKIKSALSTFIRVKSPLFLASDIKQLQDGKAPLTKMINKAMEFEDKAFDFYLKLEQKEENKDVKAFFKRLESDEKDHKRIIKDFGFTLLGISTLPTKGI